jgi:hypothetical protein
LAGFENSLSKIPYVLILFANFVGLSGFELGLFGVIPLLDGTIVAGDP